MKTALTTKNERFGGSPAWISINPKITPKRIEENARVLAELELLRHRLREENETDLLAKIALCQRPLKLICDCCGARKEVLQRCKRKWCPCCAKQLAAQRASELEYIVERMLAPKFVTLTMKNVFDLNSGAVRKLRRAFGKLRHRKLWKWSVRGGIANVEITNIGNGWHPHLHAVVDAVWVGPPSTRPRPRMSPDEIASCCQASMIEIERVWSKLLGQETSSVKVKRADKTTIAKEVLKYTVKNEDLVLADGTIGDLIRALDSCRLMTTFGKAHGSCTRDIRNQAKLAHKAKLAEWRNLMSEFDCCPGPELRPLNMFERWDETIVSSGNKNLLDAQKAHWDRVGLTTGVNKYVDNAR